MPDTVAPAPARRKKGGTSEAAPEGVEIIRVSSEPADIAPRFRGNLETLTPGKVAGWVFDAKAPGRTNVVELALDGHGLVSTQTGQDRPDVDRLAGARLRSGFQLDLRADGVQEMAASILRRALVRILRSGEDEAAAMLELRVTAAPELGDTRPPLALTPVFPLSAEFPARRPLAQWAAFFDLDMERLRRAAENELQSAGLTPAPSENAAGGARFIAFYLPQFHAIPENDEWWGPGFTEWTSVATLQKQFEKHQAPNLPADLGFYDLLNKETRRKQAELAKQYGLYGFCYYFYWFSGRRILERPLELMLREREPDMPFCLCWANEPWSRRWDGSEQDVLIAQHHDIEGDLAILDDLAPFFADDRYIRIDGKALFVIYRMSLMAEPRAFVMRLRQAALERGLGELFICNVMSFGDTDPTAFGCDAAVEFPPHNTPARGVDWGELGVPPSFKGQIYDYASLLELSASEIRPFAYFPGAMPRWDNTARKGATGHLFAHSTPELFEAWLRSAGKRALEQWPDTPLVFINSWNEWGEGAHLEPDRLTGRRYLESVRRVASADPRPALAKPSDSDEAAMLAALTAENQLLSRRLADLQVLTAPECITPGFPETLASLDHDANGVACIDGVNVQERRRLFSAARAKTLHIRGWHFSRTVGEDEGGYAYLILTNPQTRKSYFTSILHHFERPDVAEAHGVPVERATGFELRVDCSAVEPGTYAMRIVETRGRIASHLDPGARLTLT